MLMHAGSPQPPRMKRLLKPGKIQVALSAFLLLFLVGAFLLPYLLRTTASIADADADHAESFMDKILAPEEAAFDKEAYDTKMLALAHIRLASTTRDTSTTTPAGMTLIQNLSDSTSVSAKGELWPVAAPYPLPGALLPDNRIVAYYGNFYSTKMGILGEHDEGTVLAKLKSEKAAWEAADPTTPVVMGIDYIAVTAQGSPQADGTYKLRMPAEHIQRAIDMANKVDGIVILEIQVGLSTFQKEIPLLEEYLKLPNVHLAIDPEFSMKDGSPPGDVIGTVGSADVNYAANYLAELVKANNLPPKILVIHRFTENMVTGAENIKPLPEVQMVMVMDGWGFGAKKINTYKQVIYPEPVQFTGFKLFYKNDLKPPSTRLLTPREVLELTPSPSFIQYQ